MTLVALSLAAMLAVAPQIPTNPAPSQAPSAALEVERALTELAIEIGRKDEITPIPLLDEQGRKRGELFDRFLLGAIAARAALAKGETPVAAPNTLPGKGLLPLNVVVVAPPWTCGSRTVGIENVELTPVLAGNTGVTRRLPRSTSAADVARLLPGMDMPSDAVVSIFPSVPLTNAVVTFRYAEPACTGETTTVTASIRQTPVRISGPLTTKLPADAADLPSPTVVRVRGIVDRTGQLRDATLSDGPAALGPAALEIARQLRIQAPTINGVPTVQAVAIPISFTSTGQPVAAAPGGAAPPARTSSGLPAPPPAMRGATHETKTADVSGLTRATSRCAVAEDDEYGRSPEKPVKIGGGVVTMAVREVAYMRALRGPSGQGLHFLRRGSTAPREGTLGPLDIYEVNHAGLESPITLYLDAYQEDELKAPAGFVCAEPLRPVSKPAPGTPVTGETTANPSTGSTTDEGSTPDVPGLSAASSQCGIATDDSYGYTTQNAVKLGGEMTDGNTRAQQFLRALRGPNGEGVRFRRTGSQLAPDAKTVLVVYELRHAGLEKPVRVYLDRFHLEDPKAPKGLICSAPIAR